MMTKRAEQSGRNLLCEAMLSLQTVEECQRFLDDLCTVAELRAMTQRVEVAMLLNDGQIYRDILETTGASSATISRVNRCLHHGAEGYKLVIGRMKEREQGE